MDASTVEYLESTTIRFEWTLRGLKNLFDSSKGDSKSKVTKSMRFGGVRWQILFYANSGNSNSEGQSFVSLYLSCEPTTEEKDNSVNGKWVREGLFKFGFELRNLEKTVLFNNKEAHDHSFSYRTQNWGWAQFARRDSVYYQAPIVKQQDAFLIICTITSSPVPAVAPPTTPRTLVPKDLLDAMGGLLDDPVYSDVEFILPRRGGSMPNARTIYAARRLLKRVEYFDTMFGSGFAESSASHPTLELQRGRSVHPNTSRQMHVSRSITREFEDSDDEDDEDEVLVDTDIDTGRESSKETLFTECSRSSIGSAASDTSSWTSVPEGDGQHQGSGDQDDETRRNVRAKLSHPSSPRSTDSSLPRPQAHEETPSASNASIPGPTKVRVVIEDVAYTTFRAVLYYIYTDTIVFAPLSSSFLTSTAQTPKLTAPISTPSILESQTTIPFSQRPSHQQSESSGAAATAAPQSRREWISQWAKNNDTGRPRPCSAKAVYRLADKYDLQELKQRAFQHIVKSLTTDNVAYEVFSTFSAAFEDVRKVQVRFFLENWAEIRGSDSMQNVWQHIRLGRHPGFEEVWPIITVNLEYNPRAIDTADGDRKDSGARE